MLRACAAVAVDEAYYHYRFHDGSVTKRYSEHVPKSHDLSNDAIEALLRDYEECMRRMVIRRRKMAVEAVRNYCHREAPGGFMDKWRIVRAYMNRRDVRAWFADVKPFAYQKGLAVKLALVKYRMALLCTLLFGFVFNKK